MLGDIWRNKIEKNLANELNVQVKKYKNFKSLISLLDKSLREGREIGPLLNKLYNLDISLINLPWKESDIPYKKGRITKEIVRGVESSWEDRAGQLKVLKEYAQMCLVPTEGWLKYKVGEREIYLPSFELWLSVLKTIISKEDVSQDFINWWFYLPLYRCQLSGRFGCYGLDSYDPLNEDRKNGESIDFTGLVKKLEKYEVKEWKKILEESETHWKDGIRYTFERFYRAYRESGLREIYQKLI